MRTVFYQCRVYHDERNHTALQTLRELENRGISGCILTTDYLTFSEPKALDKLAGLKNIELKMYCASESRDGFHTKGYIFKSDEIYRIIVGSSNLTLSVLTRKFV